MKSAKQVEIDDFFTKADEYFNENPDAEQATYSDGDCLTIEIMSSSTTTIALELCNQVDIDYFNNRVEMRNRTAKIDQLTKD